MNLCCKFVAGVYAPTVRNIPISKDEQYCMREAQLHSAPTLPNQSPTSVQPLNPGAHLGPGKRKPSKAGSNALLKQAIANRIAPIINEDAKKDEGPPIVPIHKTDSNEMSKSVLVNPAWYRDEEGRTGYKCADWDKISNKQKEVVKPNRNQSKKEGGKDIIVQLDNDLLSDGGSKRDDPRKMSKEDAKMQKAMEKELKRMEEKAKKAEKEAKKKEEKEMKKKNKKKKSSKEEEQDQRIVVDSKQTLSKTEATVLLSPTQQRKLTKEHTSESSLSTNESINTIMQNTSQSPHHLTPKRMTIGERRDSNMSELSKNSFKSVTFNDRVETREIERNYSISSSENDNAIMSDDEYTVRHMAPRILQRADDYDDYELADFEEQERLALLAAKQYERGYEEDEDDDEFDDEGEPSDSSQNSYYAEDVEGADIYLKNEHGFLEIEMNREAEMNQYDKTYAGSMSKLHAEDSSNSVLMDLPGLPRSASGYFEPPPPSGYMNQSYQEAVGRSAQETTIGPVYPYPDRPSVHKSPPSKLRPTSTQRSVYENVGDEHEMDVVPVSVKNRQARERFFHESNAGVRSRTVDAMSSSTDSNATIKAEDEMRKKFVAKFGARKAPIATKEDDPADPMHVMGSQESVNSTDSRESVVSAASTRAEAMARRNFNY